MSDTIDILCAIDAEDILSQYPNPSQNSGSPTGVSANLIYMIVQQGSAISGNGQGELNISANIGDNIRWRETSLSLNFEYSVQFYNFSSSSQDLITLPPVLVGGVNNDGTLAEVQEAMPKHVSGAPPWLPTSVNNTPYHYWQSTAQEAGNETYHWQFLIADSNGNVQGYFQWDPYITISQP